MSYSKPSKVNSTESHNFERKEMKNGTPNPKYVDLLDVDKTIAGQIFGCFSFITPEKILKQKEIFFFEEFLKKWEATKSMEKFAQFINFISFKYKVNSESMMQDYEEFVKTERETIMNSSIEDEYKTFVDREETALETRFNSKYKFQTSVRGFKSRGNFASQEEAELRAKLLRESDPNFDIFVGPVGQWLCWDPEAYKTGKVEYMEEELNQLANEKHNNETNARSAFEQRIKETKEKAIADNAENAAKHGNVITQTIDKDGTLIGVGTTQEKALQDTESISVADIRSELFEGDDIIMGKTDNGKSRLISGPFGEPK